MHISYVRVESLESRDGSAGSSMIKSQGVRKTGVKRFIKIFLNVLKWALLTALGVEIFCFLVIIATNLMLFNQPWEGSAANY